MSTSRAPVILLLSPLLITCGGDASGPDPDPATTGRVRVVATTTGIDLDPDGYRVTVGGRTQTLASNGSVVFDDVPTGRPSVEVSGVSANCRITSTVPSNVEVSADRETEIVVEVDCGAFAMVACPDLSLATGRGLPLDPIPLSGLPSTLESPVAASVTLDGTTHAGFAFVTDSEAGGSAPSLVVPIHPENPFEGGEVSLLVSDGTRACPPLALTIEPLPSADGELTAVVDLLQALVDEQATALGATRDSIVSTPLDQLPRELWPLALTQTVLDDPAHDRSLRDAARGDLGSEVRDWLDRLLARTGLRAALTAAPAPGLAPGARAVSDLQCTPLGVGNQGGILEKCMSAAAEARRRADGVSKEVSEDIGLALSALGDFAGEYGIPLVDVVDAMFTAVFWVIYNTREQTAAVYPSRFLSMDLDVDRRTFAEDEEAEGSITLATVTATSEGYDLGEVLFDAFTEGLSAAEAAGKFDFSTGNPLDEAFSRFRPIIKEKLAEKSVDEIEIPAETFGPADVNDPEWIQANVIGESLEPVSPLGYRPFLFGSATFSVRTYDGKFGGQQIQRDVEITIPAIQLLITPKDTLVEAGDPEAPVFTTFDVEVINAKWPDSVDLDLSEHPRQGLAEITLGGGSEHEVDYLAPSEPDFDEPDFIVVRHTGSSGARANGPKRETTATVRFGRITVTPRGECVDPGEPLQFEAEVEGLEDEAVKWTADIGLIDESSGAWTAPSDAPAGTIATITATSVSEASVSDEVEVRIGQCDLCQGNITLSGGFAGSAIGPTNFVLDGDELTVGFNGAFVEPYIGDRISGGFVVTGFTGEPGSWSIDEASVVQHDVGGLAWYQPELDLDCGGCGGTLTILEASETVLRGEVTATMFTFPFVDDVPEPPTTATMTFEAWKQVPGTVDDPYTQCSLKWQDGG